jgi:hypothetical protein
MFILSSAKSVNGQSFEKPVKFNIASLPALPYNSLFKTGKPACQHRDYS